MYVSAIFMRMNMIMAPAVYSTLKKHLLNCNNSLPLHGLKISYDIPSALAQLYPLEGSLHIIQ